MLPDNKESPTRVDVIPLTGVNSRGITFEKDLNKATFYDSTVKSDLKILQK